MEDHAKTMKDALASRRIDVFIREYERLSKLNLIKNDSESLGCKQEYERWKEELSRIANLLNESSSTAKQWMKYSNKNKSIQGALSRSNNQLQIKYNIKLTSGLQTLCKLMANIDSYKDILPFCEGCQELHVQNPLEKYLLLKFKVPFLNERCVVTHISVIDRLDENNKIIIYGEGIQGKGLDQFMKINGDLVKLKSFVVEITLSSEGYYDILFYAVLDDTISLIPNLVLKKLLQLSSTLLLSNLINIIEKSGNNMLAKYPLQNKELNACISQRLHTRTLGKL